MIDEKALEAAAWEGVWQMFQTRHGPQDIPRLDDLKEAHRSSMTWEEYLIAGRAAITAYLAARAEAGFVEVPREPTEAQRAAGDEAIDQYESRHLILAEDREAMAVAAYRAMLAAKGA